MAQLETEVRFLKGIGEKKAQAFHKLGVFTLYDLISFFPRRYEDRSVYKPIALTQNGESVCIRALAADTPRLTRIRRGLDLVKLRAVDESGMVEITYFNQPYRKDSIRKGESYDRKNFTDGLEQLGLLGRRGYRRDRQGQRRVYGVAS